MLQRFCLYNLFCRLGRSKNMIQRNDYVRGYHSDFFKTTVDFYHQEVLWQSPRARWAPPAISGTAWVQAWVACRSFWHVQYQRGFFCSVVSARTGLTGEWCWHLAMELPSSSRAVQCRVRGVERSVCGGGCVWARAGAGADGEGAWVSPGLRSTWGRSQPPAPNVRVSAKLVLVQPISYLMC